MDTRKTI